MLLSCLAMLLGVAVIIFVVFTIGMKELHETNPVTKCKAVHLNLSFFLYVRDPAVTWRVRGISLNCTWSPICTGERKYQIENEKAQNLSGKKARGTLTDFFFSDGRKGEKVKVTSRAVSLFLATLTPNNPTNSGTKGKWRLHIVVVLDHQTTHSVEKVKPRIVLLMHWSPHTNPTQR